DQIQMRDNGTVRYRCKRAWKDGSTAVDLHPFDLLARLYAFISPPRFNMVRYHGVLSAHAQVRPEVVPQPPRARARPQRW
ncbi:MAG: transposase, partial [Myxococcota bacterium]